MMITKIKKIILSFTIALVTLTVIPASVAMAAPPQCTLKQSSGLTIFPAWYDDLLCSDGNIKSPADPSLGGDSGTRFGTWMTIIAMNVVKMILTAVGYASLAYIIFGGFKYMTSGDSSAGTVSARKTIQNAIIGLVLSIASVAIVTFVAGRISG